MSATAATTVPNCSHHTVAMLLCGYAEYAIYVIGYSGTFTQWREPWDGNKLYTGNRNV